MSTELVITGDSLPLDLSRKGLADLVDQLKKGPTLEIPVEHEFVPHMYIRTVCIPARTGVVSFVHKTTHPFVVTKGKILVWTENKGVILIEAPYRGVTEPGTCRLAVALEDTVWTTFHVTDETDVPTLEKLLVWSPREAAELEEKEPKCLS